MMMPTNGAIRRSSLALLPLSQRIAALAVVGAQHFGLHDVDALVEHAAKQCQSLLLRDVISAFETAAFASVESRVPALGALVKVQAAVIAAAFTVVSRNVRRESAFFNLKVLVVSNRAHEAVTRCLCITNKK